MRRKIKTKEITAINDRPRATVRKSRKIKAYRRRKHTMLINNNRSIRVNEIKLYPLTNVLQSAPRRGAIKAERTIQHSKGLSAAHRSVALFATFSISILVFSFCFYTQTYCFILSVFLSFHILSLSLSLHYLLSRTVFMFLFVKVDEERSVRMVGGFVWVSFSGLNHIRSDGLCGRYKCRGRRKWQQNHLLHRGPDSTPFMKIH